MIIIHLISGTLYDHFALVIACSWWFETVTAFVRIHTVCMFTFVHILVCLCVRFLRTRYRCWCTAAWMKSFYANMLSFSLQYSMWTPADHILSQTWRDNGSQNAQVVHDQTHGDVACTSKFCGLASQFCTSSHWLEKLGCAETTHFGMNVLAMSRAMKMRSYMFSLPSRGRTGSWKASRFENRSLLSFLDFL